MMKVFSDMASFIETSALLIFQYSHALVESIRLVSDVMKPLHSISANSESVDPASS